LLILFSLVDLGHHLTDFAGCLVADKNFTYGVLPLIFSHAGGDVGTQHFAGVIGPEIDGGVLSLNED